MFPYEDISQWDREENSIREYIRHIKQLIFLSIEEAIAFNEVVISLMLPVLRNISL